MISCEGTGKTIEQAVENALFELKAPREDVDIKVLSEGGFLKKAKVLVTISEDAREKYEKKESQKKAAAEPKAKAKEEPAPKAEPKVEEKAQQKQDEDFSANFMKKKIEKTEKEQQTDKEVYAKKKTPEEFLKEVLTALQIDAEISRTADGEYVTYSVIGEGLNELIGHHGESMNALEHLMRLACQEEDHKKILLDLGGYRARRAESLTALAKRVADKVAKTGRYHRFEPMSASERKVIHTALQGDDRVTTMSKGEDPQRYLIVFPRNYEE